MATVTTAKNAECARTVLSMFASAEAVAPNVRQYAPIVTKSVRTALTKKSVADVTYVKTALVETETSAITARHVRCAQNMFASVETVAQNVRQYALNVTKNAANALMISARTAEFVRSAVMPRDFA